MTGDFWKDEMTQKMPSKTTRGIKELVLPEPSMHLSAVFLQEFNSILVFGGSLCFGYCLELENLQLICSVLSSPEQCTKVSKHLHYEKETKYLYSTVLKHCGHLTCKTENGVSLAKVKFLKIIKQQIVYVYTLRNCVQLIGFLRNIRSSF